MRKLFSQLGFSLWYNKGNILFIFLLLVSIFLLVFNSQSSVPVVAETPEQVWWQGFNWWTNWLDPIVGMFTFLVALGVWWTHNLRNWEDQLPKRLTIHYEFNGKEVMRCEEVYLSSEGDIRPWAQQLGSQMSGSQRLQFEPFLKEEKATIEFDGIERKFYKLHTVTFYLTKLPAKRHLPHHELAHYQFMEQRREGGLVIWSKRKDKV